MPPPLTGAAVSEVPSGPGTGTPKWAHSVLGLDYVDSPGHPTRAAYDEVVAFFRERLPTTD